jgi:putative membrane protein
VGEAGAANAMATAVLIGYAALQAVVFAAVVAIGLWPPARRLMTPGLLKRERTHARAMEQFAHRRHASGAPAGIMIYASLAERRIEIIGDEAIHETMGEAAWNEVVKAALSPMRSGDMTAGLVLAIQRCGEALAQRFPRAVGHVSRPNDEDLAEI